MMSKEKFSNINSETFYGRITEDGKFEKVTPLETTITMTVDDIKTKEVQKEEKTKQDYDKLLLKVYWFLKGIDNETPSSTVYDLLEEIEDYL
jgi:hypothetical protein